MAETEFSVTETLRQFGQRRGVEPAEKLADAFAANELDQQITEGEKRRLLRYLNRSISEPEPADKN